MLTLLGIFALTIACVAGFMWIATKSIDDIKPWHYAAGWTLFYGACTGTLVTVLGIGFLFQ
jgi:uncharacterized membrane protein YfcA